MVAAKFLAAVMVTAFAAIPISLRYLVKHKNLGKAPATTAKPHEPPEV